MMSHIGQLGHLAILLPASAVLSGLLLWAGRREEAKAFLAALGLCLVVVLLAKLVGYACEARTVLGLGVESPSGHAAVSAVFFGCLALLLGAERPLRQRASIYIGAAVLVVLIGLSRVVVEAHTPQDVIAGLVIGTPMIAVFQLLRGPPRIVPVSLGAVAVGAPVGCALLIAVLWTALHWTPEDLIAAIAPRIGAALGVCG